MFYRDRHRTGFKYGSFLIFYQEPAFCTFGVTEFGSDGKGGHLASPLTFTLSVRLIGHYSGDLPMKQTHAFGLPDPRKWHRYNLLKRRYTTTNLPHITSRKSKGFHFATMKV